ncbi:MAG: insulinase family protein, partial [bacterium]|nr:insulinase family protein [bacterium]
IDGDANLVNTELDRFLAVTGDQVRQVAKKYFKPEARAVLEIVPAPKEEGKSE